ncbi:hypothetical protein PUMCH_004318 [Australozyma saopauloensis]|uniref:Hap4 transcription factor heteromerisation domain-containing protein n=1 Tax=Australozyma saopauloensis TaxID=291208 RepID=A0AAX4HEU0_9ASCO|nr:hypothetical protein PUMCH_004318 [[Candida] saopauloensis]
MSCTSDRPSQPILTITTSKNWVLPPRPKNTRKAKAAQEKRKSKPATTAATATPDSTTAPATRCVKQSSAAVTHASTPTSKSTYGATNGLDRGSRPPQPSHPSTLGPAAASSSTALNLESPEDLVMEMRAIELENYHLKTKLLLLIHDYKTLKCQVVLQPPITDLYDSASTARKRMFGEMGDPMSDLIMDLNGLSHASPAPASLVSPVEPEVPSSSIENELFNFVNLDESALNEYEEDGVDDELDEDSDSVCLSRMTSPASESDEHLLMTTLTRSTTVSTTNSTSDKKLGDTFKLYDLPSYLEDDYAFLFENMSQFGKKMSIIEEDHYNQVTDFLEEKLLSNDVKYYVEKSHALRQQ